MKPIGRIHTPYRERGDAPRQAKFSGGAEGTIEIYDEYIKGMEGLEECKYIVILFYFDRLHGYSLTATPPGSLTERGVFASRSPHRPNRIGMTVAEVLKIEKNTIRVKNVDMLDNTPVIDIKPYIKDLDISQ
ncbi:MAG: tRNA (N6-threonylcarbamoyladenosine(37)-N6)-methyltransferase TrmO [Actinobacteria bacterium]|nr:tRNA (N6-threonylcarbamoyladenosine(37)-N6)-methyltransferase TrmO [Actinomycetota bacterium]